MKYNNLKPIRNEKEYDKVLQELNELESKVENDIKDSRKQMKSGKRKESNRQIKDLTQRLDDYEYEKDNQMFDLMERGKLNL